MIQNNLLGDVLKIAHDAAKDSGFVTPHTLEILDEVSRDAMRRTQYSTVRDAQERANLVNNGFSAITSKIHDLKDEQVNNLSRLTALDSIVTNAVNSAGRAADVQTPKEQVDAYLTRYFSEAEDKGKAADLLQSKMEGMIISLVHTMHPTIYHTPEARMFESELTKLLENPDNLMTGRLSKKGEQAVQELFTRAAREGDIASGFMAGLAGNKLNISPKRPMTVSLETKTEENNVSQIRQQLKEVVAAWNESVTGLKVAGLQEADRGKLTINAEREAKMFEFRTWGQSADADGREKSTSQFLYESIQKNVKEVDAGMPKGAKQDKGMYYAGPTLDMRQNAKKVHLPYISALCQIKLRNSENERTGKPARYETAEQRQQENDGVSFADYCHQFMKAREEKYERRKDPNGGLYWRGPEHSLFQQLDGFNPEKPQAADDRAEFLSEIIRRNYKLIPDQMRADTIAFNSGIDTTVRLPHSPHGNGHDEQGPGIYEIKKTFLKRYEKDIQAAGLDPSAIDYSEMIRVTVPHDINKPDGPKVSLRGAWDTVVKLNGWEMLHGGLQYNRLPSVKTPKEPVLDFWNYVNPQQIMVQNFLQTTRKPGKEGFVEIPTEERAVFNDTAKRLFVINDAIDKYGPQVATRYQIANFSEPTDFLALLKLFQDTGIAKIEKGVVKSSKLAIQPLLETGEDLRNAPAVFTKLLENPITKSFWQARGNEAEIMLGFSDGAASVGNFASQWEIYQASRQLTELFEKHGIKVRFFQGRGRGVDRGGSIDPSLQMELMSPEVMKRGIYDATIQSDLPMDLAASPAYGKDYFTKVMLGTLDSAVSAEKRMAPAEKARLAGVEKNIEWIANRSAEIYQSIVRSDDPEGALKLFNNTVDNPFKSSRASVRGGVKKSTVFDDVRAIPKEYLLNGIDLQAHNVGLKQALTEFEKEKGPEAVAALNEHPFFRAITQTIRTGMDHYDPAIARAHAKATGSETFVEKVIPHLDDLAGKLDYITGAAASAAEKSRRPGQATQVSFHRPSWSSVLDQIAHGIIVTGLTDGKSRTPVSSRPDQQQWVDTLYNALFVTAQEIGHRDLPWKAKTAEMGMAS